VQHQALAARGHHLVQPALQRPRRIQTELFHRLQLREALVSHQRSDASCA